MKKRSLFCLLACLLIVAFTWGCASQQVAKCNSPEDNPSHHYLVGMEALEKGDLDTAQAKFDRALYCDDNFAPAYSGFAITSAMKARIQLDAGFGKVETDRALNYLKKADKASSTPEDRFDYLTATIRVYMALQTKGWLDTAKDAFDATKDLNVDESKMPYYQGKEAAVYFMGAAYLQALEFQQARDKFAAVLNTKGDSKWHEKADRLWKKTDKIVRAMAGITVGEVGRKIAIKDSISRGDLAALLVDELKIDQLFAGRISAQSQADKMKAEFTPADVLNYHFKDEVLNVMKWKIRGLEPRYDEKTQAYLFNPADKVKRGEMALILEDVLIKLAGDEKLATAYFGQERSPFPDVKPTSAFYNAVMNMTTRNIMEGELSGEFRVDEPVDGAEAVLAIRMLKEKMNTH